MLMRHMEYFVTLAEEGHFGRAAQLCGISQPTLSQAIKKLEDDLGVLLIIRGKRFAGLTAEGERILPWARQIMSNFDSMKDDLSGRRKGGLTGTLRLGVTPAAMSAMPRLTEKFEGRNPLARISIVPMTSQGILAGVEGFTLDGGVLWHDPGGLENVITTPLGMQVMMFACTSDHPFAAEKTIPWNDAMTQPLITLDGDLPMPLGPDAKPLIRARIHCNSLAGILAHLRTGRWCAVVPDGIGGMLGAGDDIVLRPLVRPSIALPLIGVVAARSPKSPMVQALSNCMESIASV